MNKIPSGSVCAAGLVAIAILITQFMSLVPAAAQEASATCEQPKPVCEVRAAVFPVSAFDPVGSAVRISHTRLVTSRHVVADRATATVLLPDGRKIEAKVVPSDYPGDLIALETSELPPGPVFPLEAAKSDGPLFTIGADIGSGTIRAYAPGKLLFAPQSGKPLARLHHDARSQPGNSGGALVDAEGRLAGIIASGGEGRFEAVPARAIAELLERSGEQFTKASAEIGAAVRICTTLVEQRRKPRERVPPDQAKSIETACTRSGNRQLTDLGAQTLARGGHLQAAIGMFERGLSEDGNAVNTRLSLAIAHHLNRDFEAALPHLRWLMSNTADDLQVLRLSIQAGTWADDKDLATRALARLKDVNPQSATAAERFMSNPPRRPPKQSPAQ